MSAIPPNSISSVLQSGVAQQVQSKDRDSDDNMRTDASRRLTGAGGTGDIIEIEETDTADTEVHPDTMGTGGQGRFDAPPDEAGEAEPDAEQGITRGPDGQTHLDLSA